ncbi:MAG: cytochrome c oxidase subunit 3, partial [Ilumatobacteraceae bacterium]
SLRRPNNHPWVPGGVGLAGRGAFFSPLVLGAWSFPLPASAGAGQRPGGQRAMQRWLLATVALGAAFLTNQLLEYRSLDFRADDGPYGSIYWVLTGLHGAHVTAGLAAMALLYVRAVRSTTPAAVASWAGGVSLFWHLVDVVWIFVFTTIWILQ